MIPIMIILSLTYMIPWKKSQKLARENLIKSKEKSKIYFDQEMNPQSLKGDFVYLQKNLLRVNYPINTRDHMKYLKFYR